MQVRVKYHADIDRLQWIEGGDWVDLRTAERYILEAGEFKRLSLGVSMELPEGYEAIIAPRSSTFERYGILLTNGIGIVDESYKGDNDIWHFPVYATRMIDIPKNTRICQFRIFQHQPYLTFVEAQSLGNKDRKGFGSTG